MTYELALADGDAAPRCTCADFSVRVWLNYSDFSRPILARVTHSPDCEAAA